MEVLKGMEKVRVDDRNRIAVPSKFIEYYRGEGYKRSDGDQPIDLLISVDLEGKLSIFTKNVHDEMMAFLEKKPKYDPVWMEIRSVIRSSEEDVKLDKQNRMKIPTTIGGFYELSGEIVLQGAGDRLQLLSMKKWKETMSNFEGKIATAFGNLGSAQG